MATGSQLEGSLAVQSILLRIEEAKLRRAREKLADDLERITSRPFIVLKNGTVVATAGKLSERELGMEPLKDDIQNKTALLAQMDAKLKYYVEKQKNLKKVIESTSTLQDETCSQEGQKPY